MEETKVVDQLSPLEHGSRHFPQVVINPEAALLCFGFGGVLVFFFVVVGVFCFNVCFVLFVSYCEDEQNYSVLLCAKKYFKMTVLCE